MFSSWRTTIHPCFWSPMLLMSVKNPSTPISITPIYKNRPSNGLIIEYHLWPGNGQNFDSKMFEPAVHSIVQLFCGLVICRKDVWPTEFINLYSISISYGCQTSTKKPTSVMWLFNQEVLNARCHKIAWKCLEVDPNRINVEKGTHNKISSNISIGNKLQMAGSICSYIKNNEKTYGYEQNQ